LNQEPVDIPDDISEGDATQVSYKNIGDSTWFFHIKALGPTGWGGTTHYAVNIDSTPPASFRIEITPRKRTVVRQPTIFFTTTDQTSGIDHYEIKLIKVGSAGIVTEEDIREGQMQLTPFFIESTSPYRSPPLTLGTYDVIVRAYDRAGNFREETEKMKVVTTIFTPFGDEGFLIRGGLVITWTWFWILLILLILLALYLAHFLYRRHNEVEAKLAKGIWNIGHKVAEDLKVLIEKRKEYGKKSNRFASFT